MEIGRLILGVRKGPMKLKINRPKSSSKSKWFLYENQNSQIKDYISNMKKNDCHSEVFSFTNWCTNLK
jgi:hypothetical protein